MDTQEENRQLFKCTEHNVGQVTAGEMTLCMRINPDSPTQRQSGEQTVTKSSTNDQ